MDSCVRGYHYYQNIWDPFIGEVLPCLPEDGNPHDRYAVAVKKLSRVVGHVPRRISTLCYVFLRRGGAISCIVTGTRRYSYDLTQGGMEIPCQLKFTGDDTQKIKRLLEEDQKDKDHAKGSLDPSISSCTTSKPAYVEPELESSTSSRDSCVSVQATLDLHVNGGTEIWVQHDRTRLNVNDKIILEEGEELSDKHIQFAQKLIKEQFPSFGGLFSPLLQDKCYNLHDGSVQIIHCLSRHHWIAVSNVGCNENSVNLYDSSFRDVDPTTYALIKNMFGGDQCEVSMKKVQEQDGIKDCGVFAIAFITSIVHGEDPCDVFYKQENMREHLLDCYEKLIITPFPKQ